MSGSAAEPLPQHAAEQMRTATERLRDKAWMVSPLTSAPLQATDDDHAESAAGADA